MSSTKQCKACPWKKTTNPDNDIPNGYCREKHKALKSTIAEQGHFNVGAIKMMACHDTPVGKEQPCVGWLMHQLGPGNNLALRMRAIGGTFGELVLDGEQHETFEATLGET